jgi:flavin-dependent dehydrogenase
VRAPLDLLVVGAGPVGMAAAIDAARRGMSVAVADPRSEAESIDKACGEGLMPTAVAHLATLGIEPHGHVLTGITYVSADGRHQAQADFPSLPGMGVRRTDLSALLRLHSGQAGVALLAQRVTDLIQHEGHVDVCLGVDRLQARWVIAADGLHSPMRRLLGLEASNGTVPRYGLRRHHSIAPWTPMVEVHWAVDSEAYVTPVAQDLVGVAILGRRGGSFEERLASFPLLRERLGASAATPVLGAGPLRQRSRSRTCGRVLLVGDAAGYVDALTGEGLAVGLGQARAAIECIARGRPEDYEERWHQVTRRSRLLTSGLLAATSVPSLRRRLVSTAQARPGVFAWGVRLAA